MLKTTLISLLLLVNLYAGEFDNLLEEFAQESDLSVETKKENSGQLLLYTRSDLENMKARTLKDVMKHFPSFSYHENRYGNPDFFDTGALYSSTNQVRIYIDNQEISNGIFGTAYSIFGNIDIDFVDHIEIYTITPSYGISVETNNVVVKLYSKDATRDAGGTASLRYGSRNTNQETLSYSQKTDSYSYYAYATNVDDNSMSIDSYSDTKLSKDKQDIHLFANLKTKKDTIQINYLKREQDAFASVSPSASTLSADTDVEYFHIGYERDILNNLSMQLNYDRTEYTLTHTDALTLNPSYAISTYDNTLEDQVLSSKLQYIKKINQNELTAGVKYKYNNFKNYEKLGTTEYASNDFNEQSTSTLFLEDTYSLSKNLDLIAGVKYVDIRNNGGIKNQEYTSFRAGGIYSNNLLSTKIFLNSDSSAPVNYNYISNLYSPDDLNSLKMQGINALTYSIENKNKKLFLQYVASYIELSNLTFISPTTRKIISNKEKVNMYSTYINTSYKINANNQFKALFAYGKVDNTPTLKNDNGTINGYVSFSNTFGKISFYNEVYFHDDLETSDNMTFEYAIAVIYKLNNNLELSLKGDNIFYSGYEYSAPYTVVNPSTGQLETQENQVTDRLILAQMKYYF